MTAKVILNFLRLSYFVFGAFDVGVLVITWGLYCSRKTGLQAALDESQMGVREAKKEATQSVGETGLLRWAAEMETCTGNISRGKNRLWRPTGAVKDEEHEVSDDANSWIINRSLGEKWGWKLLHSVPICHKLWNRHEGLPAFFLSELKSQSEPFKLYEF